MYWYHEGCQNSLSWCIWDGDHLPSSQGASSPRAGRERQVAYYFFRHVIWWRWFAQVLVDGGSPVWCNWRTSGRWLTWRLAVLTMGWVWRMLAMDDVWWCNCLWLWGSLGCKVIDRSLLHSLLCQADIHFHQSYSNVEAEIVNLNALISFKSFLVVCQMMFDHSITVFHSICCNVLDNVESLLMLLCLFMSNQLSEIECDLLWLLVSEWDCTSECDMVVWNQDADDVDSQRCTERDSQPRLFVYIVCSNVVNNALISSKRFCTPGNWDISLSTTW